MAIQLLVKHHLLLDLLHVPYRADDMEEESRKNIYLDLQRGQHGICTANGNWHGFSYLVRQRKENRQT